MQILVTGTAGFIGNALALRLLERGDSVTARYNAACWSVGSATQLKA